MGRRPMSKSAFNEALEELGLSQRQLARLTDRNDRTIRGYAAGDDPVPLIVERLLHAWLRLKKLGHWAGLLSGFGDGAR